MTRLDEITTLIVTKGCTAIQNFCNLLL